MSRRSVLAGIASLAALPLAGCATDSASTTRGPGLLTAENVSRLTASPGAPIAAASTGMTRFGHDLCRAGAKPATNWVASPLSIAVAFAMARVGARGATAAALDAAFGFPATGRDAAYNAITQAVITTDGPPHPATTPSPGAAPAPPVVALANALFPAHGFPVHQDYLDTLAAQYGAGLRPVDFSSRSAVDAINAWVSTQTAGRIRTLFSSLDPATKLVLANTVYLRASWQEMFGKTPTVPAPFTRTNGSVVRAATMRATSVLRYANTGNGWAALELPYASGRADGSAADVAMWLILPPPGGNPVDGLAPDMLTAIGRGWARTPVDVAVPTWKFATTIDLLQAMTGMGVTGVFGSGDFSGIAEGIDGISAAIHRATITVDETGTEAAAATGIAFATSAMLPPSIQFHADRPFAFTIVAGASRAPLFSGVLSDPTAE